MENFLFSEENIVYLVRNFFTLLHIQMENTPKFKSFANECKNIIIDCLNQVYSKYGHKLPQTQETVNKINKKCLSNAIQIIKQRQNASKQQTFKNPNISNERYDVQQHNHPAYETSQGLSGFNNGSNYAPLMPSSQISEGMCQNAMGYMVPISQAPQQNNDNMGRKNYAGDLQARQDMIKQERSAYEKPQNTPDPNALSWLSNGGQGQFNTMSAPQNFNDNQQQNNNFNQQQNNNFNPNNFNDNYNQQNNFNQPQQNNYNQPQQNNEYQTYSGSQNSGASFNDAFKPPRTNETQNALMNETDPNKRIQMAEQARKEIDNDISKYQNGQNFNPMMSPAEHNKKIMGNDPNFFF